MIPDAGWNHVQLDWDRENGTLTVAVGTLDTETRRAHGVHGIYRAVWTTQDVVSAVGDVLQNEQLLLDDLASPH